MGVPALTTVAVNSEPLDWLGTRNKIAVDAAGHVHALYTDTAWGQPATTSLYYSMKPSAGSFGAQKLLVPLPQGPLTNGPLSPSMVIDAAGGVHVSYCLAGSLELGYRYKASPQVPFSAHVVVDPGPCVATSIAVDAVGHPAIVYRDNAATNLRLARRDSAMNWSTSIVDTVNPSSATLAFDANDVAVIAFRRNHPGTEIMVARVCP